MKKLEDLLWKVFYFLIFVIAIKIAGDLAGIRLEENYLLFKILFFALPVVILVLHSLIALSLKRSILFIFLAVITGTIMEYIGLKDGTFFGGHYIYKPQIALFNVPINVILFWAVFIYTGYSITNSFLFWLKHKKPNFKIGNFWLLLLTIVFDSLFVVALDLFMDPIAVKSGSWKWLEGGQYFGVPVGNFIGWFIVTIIVTGIFRIMEYFFPEKETNYNKSIFIIPVLSYGLLALSFCFKAINFYMFNLAILGSLFMLPTVIINLFFFRKYKKSVTIKS